MSVGNILCLSVGNILYQMVIACLYPANIFQWERPIFPSNSHDREPYVISTEMMGKCQLGPYMDLHGNPINCVMGITWELMRTPIWHVRRRELMRNDGNRSFRLPILFPWASGHPSSKYEVKIWPTKTCEI